MTASPIDLENDSAAAHLALTVEKARIAKDDLTGAALAEGGGVKKPEQGVPKPFRMTFQGIPIQVDRPKGFKQAGKDEEGKPWERTYLVDYGYVPGIKAMLTPKVTDDEDLDVYLGPNADAKNAHLVLQVKADGRTPDELKAMLGWDEPADAEKVYKEHTPAKHFGGMATMPMTMFKAMLGLEETDAKKALEGIAKTIWSTAVAVSKLAGVSYDDLNRALREALGDLYPPDSARDGYYCSGGPWVVDTYDDAVVFEVQGRLMRVSYTYANGVATLVGDPVQVVRSYAPADPAAKTARLAKAFASGAVYKGKTKPLPASMKDHPATKAMPIETYDPKDANGWHYVLEAKSESWIAFVDTTGKTLLWTHREKSGGVIGDPYLFQRDDLKTMAERAQKMIKEEGGKFVVYSEDGAKKLGGPYDTKAEAVERLRQVEGHKEDAEKRVVKVLAKTAIVRPRDVAVEKGYGAEIGADQRYVLGIVLEPEEVDGQGDVYSAAEIQEAAHRYMKNFRNVGLMHKGLVNGKAFAVQSYIAPADMDVEGTKIRKGTWLLGLEVPDEELWQKIRRGDLTGLSIGGFAKRTPAAAA